MIRAHLARLGVYVYALATIPYAAAVTAWRRWFGCRHSLRTTYLVDGELPAGERGAAMAHVAECEPCRRDFELAVQLAMKIAEMKRNQ